MYRILLAASETALREQIRSLLSEQKQFCILVGEASDGATALPMILDLNPDIVITDLHMPFVDGLELSRKIKRSFPWIRIILLSGYDDLTYLQEVHSIGVEEYLHKPLSELRLSEALQRSADQLELSIQQQPQLLSPYLNATDCGRRELEHRLSSWMLGKGEAPDCEILKEHHIYRILSISGAISNPLLEAILRRFENSLPHIMFTISRNGFHALIVRGDSLSLVEEYAYGLAYALLKEARRILSLSLRIQIGDPGVGSDGLLCSCRSLSSLAALQTDQRPILGSGDAVFQPAEAVHPVSSLSVQLEWLNRQLCTDSASIEGIPNMNPARRDDRSTGVHWLHHACSRIWKSLHDSGLTLLQISEEVGLSPSHFCIAFSQEMGTPFTEYLIRLRMERAARLLSSTRMRISSVAKAVGYTDTGYFSLLFAQICGLGPLEYRKSLPQAYSSLPEKTP